MYISASSYCTGSIIILSNNFYLLNVCYMCSGMDGVFVGSGIFKSGNPADRARAIVQAVTHYRDAKLLAQVGEEEWWCY